MQISDSFAHLPCMLWLESLAMILLVFLWMKYVNVIRIIRIGLSTTFEYINGIYSILVKWMLKKRLWFVYLWHWTWAFLSSSVLLILMSIWVWVIFFLFTAHLSLGCRTDLNNSYTKRLIEMRGELSVLGVVIYWIWIQFLHCTHGASQYEAFELLTEFFFEIFCVASRQFVTLDACVRASVFCVCFSFA